MLLEIVISLREVINKVKSKSKSDKQSLQQETMAYICEDIVDCEK